MRQGGSTGEVVPGERETRGLSTRSFRLAQRERKKRHEGPTMTTNKLNKARVADLHMTMTGHVERGDIPGIVTLIGRGDEIHVDAIGMKTVSGKEPMSRHTIFRVA